MKIITIIFYVILYSLFFTACEKIDFLNLKRNNPLDEKGNMQDGISLKFNSYFVVYDNNHNDIINKGETVYLYVYIKNNGSSTANAVKATFSTTSSYASGFSPTTQVDYGDIPAGEMRGYGSGRTNYDDYYTIKFTVSNTTPANTKIPINISITDRRDNIWTSSFEVTVEGTSENLGYHSYTVVYDNNHNDIINKGETIYLSVYLKNNGSSTANAIKATFSTTSSYISGFSPITQVSYGNILAGNIQIGRTGHIPNYDYYTITFTVSNTTPANTKIPVNISITDERDNIWTSSFEVTVEGTSENLGYHSHTIVYDNNHNDIINKGETIYLSVYLENNSSSTANAVETTLVRTGD
ncbi:MAG: hypothetical protein LBG80_04885 [Bacteroidales bacterium]|jgi:hypothetical protein|nr:hypothetical protein [Bacteroidales bacterium]